MGIILLLGTCFIMFFALLPVLSYQKASVTLLDKIYYIKENQGKRGTHFA